MITKSFSCILTVMSCS